MRRADIAAAAATTASTTNGILGSALLAAWNDVSPVSNGTWTDSKNSKVASESTGSKKPTPTAYAGPPIRTYSAFDGGDDLITADSLATIAGASGALGITAVVRMGALQTHGALNAAGYESSGILRTTGIARAWLTVDSAGVYAGVYDGTAFRFARSAPPVVGTVYVVRFRFNGSNSLTVQLGTDAALSAADFANGAPNADIASRAATLNMGNDSGFGASTFTGDLYEVLVHGTLTALQESRLSALMAYKWGAIG